MSRASTSIFRARSQGVDGRDKPGHDAAETWPEETWPHEEKKLPAAAGYGVANAIVSLA
jgi:hypothetical protein